MQARFAIVLIVSVLLLLPAVLFAQDACPSGTCAPGAAKAGPARGEPPKAEGHENLPVINTLGLKALLDAKVPLVLLDARSGKFDDGQRLPGARALAPTAAAAEVAKVIPHKEGLVVTYCSNLHCPASRKLLEHLKTLGYTNVVKYPDGIEAWVKAGLPVEKAGK